MFVPVLSCAWRTIWWPSVLAASTLATVGSTLAFHAAGASVGFWNLPQRTMPLVALVVILRAWIGFCVLATALDIMRAGHRWRPFRWVSAPTAFEVAVVASAVAAVSLSAMLFLIVPGIWLALRWSQAAPILIDGRSAWFGAVVESEAITHGRKGEILLMWLAIGLAFALIEWWLASLAKFGVPGALDLSDVVTAFVHALGYAFTSAFLAATYHEIQDDYGLKDQRFSN